MQTYSVGEAIVDEMFRKVQSDVGKGINAAMNKMHEKMDELEPPRTIRDRPEAEHARVLLDAVKQLNPDELAVAAGVVAKMVAGIKKHGRLELATDDRSFLVECISELEDQQNYCAKSIIRLRQIIARLNEMGERV